VKGRKRRRERKEKKEMETWLANMLYIWFLLSIVAVALLFWIGAEIREQRKILLKDKPNNKEIKK